MNVFLKSLVFTLGCYLVFMAGYNVNNYEVFKIVDNCANTVNGDIGTFYKHQAPTNPTSFYAHAEAFTEMNWARCFRKEINK